MKARRVAVVALAPAVVVALLVATWMAPIPVLANGATQISGIGYFPGDARGSGRACDDFPDDPVDGVIGYLVLDMTGDLDGCLYTYILTSVCAPSGAYNETGIDIFVAADGNSSFQTTYRFTGKYVDCNASPEALVEIFGRCQHPITPGLGTGIYEDVTGRVDFKDDVDAVEFPYRGHLKDG